MPRKTPISICITLIFAIYLVIFSLLSPIALADSQGQITKQPWKCKSNVTSVLFELLQRFDRDFNIQKPDEYVFDLGYQKKEDPAAANIYIQLGDEFLSTRFLLQGGCNKKRFELAETAYDIAKYESQGKKNDEVKDLFFSAQVTQPLVEYKKGKLKSKKERDEKLEKLWDKYCPKCGDFKGLNRGNCDFLNRRPRMDGRWTPRRRCRPCPPPP